MQDIRTAIASREMCFYCKILALELRKTKSKSMPLNTDGSLAVMEHTYLTTCFFFTSVNSGVEDRCCKCPSRVILPVRCEL